MPGMRTGGGAFRREPSDRLRLATKVTKNSPPVYVERKADKRQTTLELLKWFPQSGRDWSVNVIFEREKVGDEEVS